MGLGRGTGLCRAGQRPLRAAVPGALFLSTGLHTGQVGFTVELHDERPEVGPDVVVRESAPGWAAASASS
ncbi:MAG: hypothetical protein ACRDY2_07775 [Acidimicrobiales bacterium]